jgi:hypothetical protein
MNTSFKQVREKMSFRLGIVTAASVGMLGCAGALGNSPAPTAAQLAQAADDACAGVPETMREHGLLAFSENVATMAPLTESVAVGKVKLSRTRGEVFTLRAEPNMTVPWLQRINNCHGALAAAGRLPQPGGRDPFIVPGTTVRIEETYTGYLLTIRAESDEVASDVVQRTLALTTAPKAPGTAEALNR